MEEINAWGAYETGTTQNARSLGRSTARHRHASAHDRARSPVRQIIIDVDEEPRAPTSQSSHVRKKTDDNDSDDENLKKTYASFGSDDSATSKKTDASTEKDALEEVEEAVVPAAPKKTQVEEEGTELSKLARDIFHVYFYSNDNSDAADMSRKKHMKKKGLHTKINGTMPYLTAYLKELHLPAWVVNLILFIEASLRGIAQVYFQNNPLSGAFILAGMFVQSSRVAVHGVIALVAGNLAGVLMGFDKSFLSCGLFGYNSFLVGLALATFYSPEKHGGYYWPVAIGGIIFAYFSSVLFVMLGKILAPYKTPPFTLPFNIATMTFLLAMGGTNNVDMAPVRIPELPSYDTESVTKLTTQAFFAGSIRGVGQVFLANDITAGILVLIGIMLCSRISALAAFLGSAVGAGVAAFVGCDRDAIENGMYGFNPSLTFTAMLMFYVPSIGSISLGIIASIMTVFIQLALAASLEPCGLPFLTLPFCLASLAFIVIQGTTSNVISVPLSSMTTPEDHLKRVSRLSDGFDLLYGAIRSSSYTGSHNSQSLFSSHRASTKRLNSALNEYDETVHGEENRGFFARIFKCCKGSEGDSIDDQDPRGMRGLNASFRISFAMRNQSYGDIDKDSYSRIFHYIDAANEYGISRSQFKEFLKSVGLSDEVGLNFACKAFQLMDLDRSGDIDVDEFIAFAQISRHMPEIRQLVVKFFDFVDLNGDNSVEINEIGAARSYLGLPPLEKRDHDRLVALCNEDEALEFEGLVNFVTIFKLKSIIKDYQSKRQAGLSLDESISSSLNHSRHKHA